MSALALLCAVADAEVTRRTPLQMMDLYDLEHVAEPQVSSDGATVAYIRRYASVMADSTYANLWTARLDGSMHRPLTTGDARDSMPRWSPDGTRIAFAMRVAEPGRRIGQMPDLPSRNSGSP